MAEEGFKRKLAAILSADVEGYSRLMDDDEEATVRTLKNYRAAINDLVQQYRGRIVDSPGDNILAEFSSVVDAVNCAVEIQRDLAERNTELAYNRQMQFRIGVNLGDVIEDDGDIYGDGVNIAARVESLAEAGGICISGRAYDQVSNKLGLEYENLGEHQVKNISVPIRVYRVLSLPGAAAHRVVQAKESVGRRWRKIGYSVAAIVIVALALGVWQFYMRRPALEPASVEKIAHQLPDKPSIAVLPFNNLSDDPEQEYFSDGMTDDIITDLSKISGLMVISSSSTFTYKGKEIKIPVIAKELGVKYVLEGSIRRAGNDVRINAQLIDAATDHHVWADRFDGKNESIFALQDKITERIVSALAVKLSASEQKVMAKKGTNNIVAYDTFLKAMSHMRKFTPKDYVKAIEYFEQAIELDPNYSEAYANLAYTYISALQGGKIFWKEIGKGFSHCRILARHNVENAMKHPTSRSYQVMAIMELFKRNFEEAIDNAEHAVSISPNDADALSTLGRIMVCVGKPEESIKYYKRSIMLDPLHKSTGGIGIAYFTLGDYEQAIKYIQKHLKDYPKTFGIRGPLASAYALLGNDVRAKKAFEEFDT
jgi:TolB-like protein/class 3 adenylate cyclase